MGKESGHCLTFASQAVEKRDIPDSGLQALPFQQNGALCSPCADAFTPTVGCPNLLDSTDFVIYHSWIEVVILRQKPLSRGVNDKSFGSDAELASCALSVRVCQ